MKKGQSTEKKVKNLLKFFKMNENTISTLMGGVVIVVIAGLIFNYFRTANLKTWQGMLLNDQEAASAEKAGESQNEELIATYKVEKGDDLWHIAEKYYKSGYNYVDIMIANGLTGTGVITAGQELKIPKVEPKKITLAEAVEEKKEIEISDTGDVVKKEEEVETTPTSTPTEAMEKSPETKDEIKDGSLDTAIQTGEYTIEKGDSYWKIAVRAYGDGYKWTKIYWENKELFSNPDLIYAGTKITIPTLE